MVKSFKEKDIRPTSLEEGQKYAVKQDIKWLNSRVDKFVSVKCPACNNNDFSLEFVRNKMIYVKCQFCNTVYVNPRPNELLLSEFYAQSKVYEYWSKGVYSKTSENRKKFLFSPRAKLLIRKCKSIKSRKANLLEVGSSSGFFLEEIKKLNFFDDIMGIEPTPDQAKEATRRGIKTYNIPYQNFKYNLKFAAVASFETIEHLYSPYNFLIWVKTYLKKGGYIMLTCPNYGGIEPQVLGKESGCVDHEHLNYFSPSSFRMLAYRAGFREIEITTPGSLDTDILSAALKNKKVSNSKLGVFMQKLFSSKIKGSLENFQDFLRKYKLSSNMLIIAKKP